MAVHRGLNSGPAMTAPEAKKGKACFFEKKQQKLFPRVLWHVGAGWAWR
jgi:hypothetical protein